VATRPDRGDEIRVFVAVALDARARAAAGEAIGRLRAAPGGADVRWLREESLHVTLRFLGNVAPARIPDLVRRMRAETAGLAPFALRPVDVVPFPNARRPRVAALRLEPEAPLAALAAAVERGVVASGFAAEARRFRAHCTLGRVKPRGHYPAVTAPVTAPGFTLDVTEAVLFRSHLDRDGAKYTRLESLPLAAPSASDHPQRETTSTGGTETS
jgi:RNA 2',3'-cyclic 3'-phosphodiesterase